MCVPVFRYNFSLMLLYKVYQSVGRSLFKHINENAMQLCLDLYDGLNMFDMAGSLRGLSQESNCKKHGTVFFKFFSGNSVNPVPGFLLCPRVSSEIIVEVILCKYSRHYISPRGCAR